MSDNRARDIVFSTKHRVSLEDYPVPDVDRDAVFTRIFEEAREYTMTGKEAMFALYEAVRYVCSRKIPGDFVECGVWRGGSALVAALTMRELGDQRPLHLYDTFEGMTAPTGADVDYEGGRAADYIDQYADETGWCYAGEDDVRHVFDSRGLGEWVRLVKGDVLQTLQAERPSTISLLRLDTDWYESTKLELELLYPAISPGGVLIVDDYGHWEGARTAVEEYFADGGRPLLNRINHTVRLAVVS
jgi:O-methyltransferase